VYYDENTGTLKLKYSSSAIDGTAPTSAVTWTENTALNLPSYTGMYVSMVLDGNSVHLAAFDANDSDLKYIHIPNYTGGAHTAVTVDQFGAVGSWAQIKLNNAGVPYISYYNSTETGGRESLKLAYAKKPVTAAKEQLQGVDDNGCTTGNWEYMTVPSLTPPQGGVPKFQKVNLGFNKANEPVLGYLGAEIEFAYPIAE
jgi:hypothetical protein